MTAVWLCMRSFHSTGFAAPLASPTDALCSLHTEFNTDVLSVFVIIGKIWFAKIYILRALIPRLCLFFILSFTTEVKPSYSFTHVI